MQVCEECLLAWRDYCREWSRENYDPAKRRARYLAARERGYYDRPGM